MTTSLIDKERCPECAKHGRDRHGDNLAVYSDGHKWCYSCGYFEGVGKITKFLSKIETHLPKEPVYLVSDCSYNYSSRALAWVEQYEITRNDLLSHNVLWSDSKQSLIFPVYVNESLVLYSTRYFGDNKNHPKTVTIGKTSSVLNILGKGEHLVLTEDVISAIKVSKFTAAMPLYGCTLQRTTVKTLQHLGYKQISLWLDPDKRTEAVQQVRKWRPYLNIGTIFSNVDPKEVPFEKIKEYLDVKCK